MAELTQRQEGDVWSAIRRTIEGMPDIEKAMRAQRYEEASAYWDAAARTITEKVVSAINGTPTPGGPQLSIASDNRLRALVNEQAEDDGLWFIARTAPEAYLQQELRRLHAAIEQIASDNEQKD